MPLLQNSLSPAPLPFCSQAADAVSQTPLRKEQGRGLPGLCMSMYAHRPAPNGIMQAWVTP